MAEDQAWPWKAPEAVPTGTRETFEGEVLYVAHLPVPEAFDEKVLYIDRGETVLIIDGPAEIQKPKEIALEPGDDIIVLVLKKVRP
jgi:hypothetical protein